MDLHIIDFDIVREDIEFLKQRQSKYPEGHPMHDIATPQLQMHARYLQGFFDPKEK